MWKPEGRSYSGICYHGTTMDLSSGVFTELEEGQQDSWEALWMAQ